MHSVVRAVVEVGGPDAKGARREGKGVAVLLVLRAAKVQIRFSASFELVAHQTSALIHCTSSSSCAVALLIFCWTNCEIRVDFFSFSFTRNVQDKRVQRSA